MTPPRRPHPSIRQGALRMTFQRSRLLRVSAELDRETTGRPPFGWIRYVREALHMSGAQLARRLNVRQPTVARFEHCERAGTITLATLRRVADALGCDLMYRFVPREPLVVRVEGQVARAVDVATRDSPEQQSHRAEFTRELLVRMPRWIWGDVDYPELYNRLPDVDTGVDNR